ncbi:glucose-6-phosphate dehydrogenase assembly protein OpcA [Arthrobacter sp. zg-Y1171]|uniref:glucose-6-phosphate dehydrogenase assembly protein OpcA n=1 Tax=unclassified Arthrobacter TaxID=235627 RepID=UPI00210830EB|nr:glucose-6-phosphate dehydrogenase assembly protein OpcA [Arthrobacter sp. zg-Y1171]MCQ1946966.1 glucose-6-phosphate dehydrogenase assembly protein OpcA [Arthrobacter sp. zg-Y1116]MCQ1986882.1 glucose-6-phosphate dehydrogenase assembly protein OpcA [Arthrobacter sp. zg-Y844]MCQ1995547.1 glucose-6-phosphate dehydrogenase assembly protein OpcA [Arthrobacter sp. zg-Y1171]UWX80427.1 glucose-6-phosphate dehydrogenase assembly protein OpcA [Arthrobacter sp. zg-Y1171]
MIVELPDTTTSKVSKEIVAMREKGGVVTLGRVLTLVVDTQPDFVEEAIAAANEASREHPCRIIVLAEGSPDEKTRLDAQIRVGGDAGASEVIVLSGYGELTGESESLVSALLLPDAPIVVWWPHGVPSDPAQTPLGCIAHRRITDAATEDDPKKALLGLADSYAAGDTDLSWTRLTNWRVQLAAVLDGGGAAQVRSVVVEGASDSASTFLLAAWLKKALKVPLEIIEGEAGTGIHRVVFSRGDGDVELARPDQVTAHLTQPGQPEQQIALPRRTLRDCLAEELRRLDPDEVFGEVLTEGLAACLSKEGADA